MTSESGPYLKAAVFCDEVIEGKDGVLSLIRVVDRLIITAAGHDAPPSMPPTRHRLKLVLMLVSGRARGTQSIQVSVEAPSGKVSPLWETTALLEGEDRGANIVAVLDYEFAHEGVYWFYVKLEGEQLTRLPFRILYQRVAPGTRLA